MFQPGPSTRLAVLSYDDSLLGWALVDSAPGFCTARNVMGARCQGVIAFVILICFHGVILIELCQEAAKGKDSPAGGGEDRFAFVTLRRLSTKRAAPDTGPTQHAREEWSE
jgi:hypothetical protein